MSPQLLVVWVLHLPKKRRKKKRASKSLDVIKSLVETIDKLAIVYAQSSDNIHELVSCFKYEKEIVD